MSDNQVMWIGGCIGAGLLAWPDPYVSGAGRLFFALSVLFFLRKIAERNTP